MDFNFSFKCACGHASHPWDPETPRIRISLSIRIRFWTVSEGLPMPYVAGGSAYSDSDTKTDLDS